MNVGAENENEKRSNEPIFDLNASSDEPLDAKKVQLSIYNDINPDRRKTKRNKEWSLRMTCTVEWFIRCSWINKFLFLDILCQSTKGCTVLEDVLKSIESIFSKDVLESFSYESTNFCYDRIPTDDNRALETEELNKAMKETFFWFLNLDPTHQVLIILKLMRLGGGGLVFMIYKSVEKYYKERQEIGKLLSVFPSASLGGEEGSEQKIKDGSKSKMSMRNTNGRSLESENSELSEFAHKKQQQLERRNAELLNYKKLRGILEEESKKPKKGETKETVDYLQILPIRLNRKIMSYIDDKTLVGFKKVGKYWDRMIDESINEKSGRNAINAKINKIIGKKADKETKKNEEKNKAEEFEFIVELGPKDFINKKNESEGALIAMSETYNFIFSRNCIIKSLDSSFYPERSGAYNNTVGIIASSNSSNVIQFYSARTGARFDFLVFGLESTVTCMTLHENRTHVYIGCKDGSLISKDIRTNKTTSIFNGHSNAVLSIFTTPSNLLSASLDNTIKYFRLWSGLCFLCIDLNPDLNISSLVLRKDKPSWAAVGTAEGVLVMADLETKTFLTKVKIHTEKITQLAHDGDFLITGSESGKIRIWSMHQFLVQEQSPENYCFILRPYYDINVGSSVLSLKFYNSQIFSGCENGTVKIISLATGKVSKTLKISSQTPITGVDITEDKLFMKLIIWHEKGIEIRTFSLQKSSSKKIAKEKDNQESKQKAPKETKKNRTSEKVLSSYARTGRGLIEAASNAYKRTTFAVGKKPLWERCCTLPALRKEHQKLFEFNTDIFTEVYNMNHLKSSDYWLYTFPRICNINNNNVYFEN